MDKIASPDELQQELRALVADCRHGVSRQKMAQRLRNLTDRVAANASPQDIPEKERAAWKQSLQRMKGKSYKGFTRGKPFQYQGQKWLVYDMDADRSAPNGFTLTLVAPDFSKSVRGVPG